MEENTKVIEETKEEVIEVKEKKKFFTKKKLLAIGGGAAALIIGALVLTRKGDNSGSIIAESLPEVHPLEFVEEAISNVSEEA